MAFYAQPLPFAHLPTGLLNSFTKSRLLVLPRFKGIKIFHA